jgi:hypothetical protein
MSAQETMPGQALSKAVFMSSTTPKPLTELLFGPASFSLSMVSLLFNKIDPSQPYNNKVRYKLNKHAWLIPIKRYICLAAKKMEQKIHRQSSHGNEA